MQTDSTNAQHQYKGPTIDDALRGWDGIPDAARDIRISLTAPERHRSRVKGTIRAAAEHLGGGDVDELMYLVEQRMMPRDGSDPWVYQGRWDAISGLRQQVAALIRLDLHGIGGPGGYDGGATARMPWAVAAGLGKSRWQASDGGAWHGAAECAAEMLSGGSDVDVPTLRALWDDGAFDRPQWYADAPWFIAYARWRMAGLLRSYGTASADAAVYSGRSVRTLLWEWDALLALVESDLAAENSRDPATGDITSEMSPLDRRARLHLDLLGVGVHPEVNSGGLRVAGIGMVPTNDGTVSLVNLGSGSPADEAIDYGEAIERACAATALAA